jgi:hypothetical protein
LSVFMCPRYISGCEWRSKGKRGMLSMGTMIKRRMRSGWRRDDLRRHF